MKRYLLFGGNDYEASGGWCDFVDSFLSIKKAIECEEEFRHQWYHIIDTQTWKMVAESVRIYDYEINMPDMQTHIQCEHDKSKFVKLVK